MMAANWRLAREKNSGTKKGEHTDPARLFNSRVGDERRVYASLVGNFYEGQGAVCACACPGDKLTRITFISSSLSAGF